MADYRYLFADLLTDQVIAELPLTGVSYSCELNGVGQLKGKLLLGDDRTQEANPSTATTATRTNLVWNPSAETDALNVTGGGNAGTTVTRETTLAKFGSACFKMTSLGVLSPGNTRMHWAASTSVPGLPATAGATYTFSVWSLSGATPRTFDILLEFFDAGGASTGSFSSPQISNNPTTWTQNTLTQVAPANSVTMNASLRVINVLIGEIHYADGALLEQSATVAPYFDGGYASLGINVKTLSWSGVANASPSALTYYTGSITGPSTVAADLWPLASLLPARTAVYVDRDRVLQWGGILWGRPYKSKDQTIEFQCLELESYWSHRRITTTYTAANTDQMTVAAALVNQIQAVPSGSLGIVVPSLTSGILISKVYNGYEQKPLMEALLELSRTPTGFDVNVDVAYDSNYNIVKTLDLAYPRRGTAYSPTSSTIPMLAFPGNVIEYDYPEDGGAVANTVYGNGAGNGAGRVMSTQSSAAALAQGWPVLESAISLSDYADPALLAQMTLAELNSSLEPVVVIQVTISTTTDPVLGSYKTGDDVRLRITDARFPSTLDVVKRIAKYEVTPGEDGPELVKLTLVETVST